MANLMQCVLPVTVTWSIPVGVAIHCVSGFVDDVMFSHNGSMVCHVYF